MGNRRSRSRQRFALVLGASLACSSGAGPGLSAQAIERFVDPGIGAAHCADYSPEARRCGQGSAQAYRDIAGASAGAMPGDQVWLRGATYSEALVPERSGEPDRPIRYSSMPGERVLITDESLDPAIDISGREHLVIEGLEIDGVRRWLWALNTHHVTLRDNRFTRALHTGGSAKTGIFFQEATHNRVVDNWIEDSTQDNLAFIRSDRNLVQGNTIRKAAHVLWVIKCGNENVIRGNHFHNEDQKIGEIYDCWEVGFDREFSILDATRRNLVEDNDFAFTPSSGDSSPYAGIQYAGQDGIIRRNRFYDTVGPGLSMTLYPEEARFNTGNRVYHNVFHGSDFAGIEISGGAGPGYRFEDNVFKNNILAESRFVANDRRWPWYTEALDGKAVQLLTGRLEGFRFVGNAVFSNGSDKPYWITMGLRTASDNPPPRLPEAWMRDHPEVFADLHLEGPAFEDAERKDFRLREGSPMVDAGAYLTHATEGGRGRVIPVEDSGYFFDGFGIAGEIGDEIQLEGGGATARIARIDRSAHTLTLDRDMSWSDGQGISLAFRESAPDIGAHELRDPEVSLSPTPSGTAEPTIGPSATPTVGTAASPLLYLPVLELRLP